MKKLNALFTVTVVALFSLAFTAGCNPYKMILDVVVEVVELAQDIVWFGIEVNERLKQETGITRVEHAQDGDLSVVRGYNAKGQVVLDSALSIPASDRESGCPSASPTARFDAALDAFLACDEKHASCTEQRLELHLAAQEVERCAH